MKPLQIFCIVIAIFTMTSCGRKTTENRYDFILSDKVKDTAAVLTAEDIGFTPPISAVSVYIYGDSIAVVHNTDKAHRKHVELYNINDNSLILGMIPIGNGPGEMVSANSRYNNDTLVIWDFMKSNIAAISIKNAVSDTGYRPILRPFSLTPKCMWPYKGRLMAINPNCFRYDRLGINNDGPRLIVSDSNYAYKESRKYEIQTVNAVYADFFISWENDRIIVLDTSEPLIEVFSTDMNPLKTIYGPELPDEIVYSTYENFGTYVAAEGDSPESYHTFCANEDFFYLAYNGDFFSRDKTMYDMNTWIFKFDWDGNFVDSYYVDHFISSMSLSEDGQSMYIFGVNRDGENVFYRARLT